MDIQLKVYPVEILTGNYQISGEMQPRGNPAFFVNDEATTTFTINNATLTPLLRGTAVGEISLPALYLPKEQIQVLIFGDYAPQEAQLLANKIGLTCFTDTYVIRGIFHGGAESTAGGILYDMPGPFFPATDVEIFAIRPLALEFGGAAELVFVQRNAVEVFYSQDET